MMDTQQNREELLQQEAEQVRSRMEQLSYQSNRYRSMTLFIFVGGILFFVITVSVLRGFGVLILLAMVIGLVFNIGRSQRATQDFLHVQTALSLIEEQFARLQMRWDELPAVPAREEGEEHPFDNDLDLGGERSLHRLLNTAVSLQGTALLRSWLLNRVPDLAEISGRRALVRELIPLTEFRSELLTHSRFATRLSAGMLDGDPLVDWLHTRQEQRMPFSSLIIAGILAVLFYISIALFIVHLVPAWACIVLLGCCTAWFFAKKSEQANLNEDTHYQRQAFGQLQPIFSFLEAYAYPAGSELSTLCNSFFLHDDRRPSLLLKKIERITSRAELSQGAGGWFLINVFVPLGFYTTYQLDQCKDLLTQYLPLWLNSWYQLEALCSLANFADLHPDYVFPELIAQGENGEQAVFQARGLGHPLIAAERKVTNDFRLDGLGEILLVTGSNMAGKSTFLRTLGINICLAQAGSVVNARALRMSLFELYACIRVTDSLADGYSYFYAEVHRLKGLLDEFKRGTQFPLFFLIDEIFKGTNHAERLIGSEAYLRALITYAVSGKGGVGAVSTHDSELVRLTEQFEQIKNVHFREDVVDGKMVFDYMLHHGPSPTRNALKIMELEGLPVRWEATSSSTD
jgi:uncharacterized membrane protein